MLGLRSFQMKAITLLAAAGAMTLAPTAAFAVPGNSQGSTNGNGWIHMNGPDPGQTGQAFAECGEDGPPPGNSASAPGSPFNEEGNAGTRYAGEQPQNSRNTASVSQYDNACANQPN
jgi:hypothetical protein